MISTTRALIILERVLSDISLGSLPLRPGIETISESLFSPGQADPNFTLSNSACFSIIEQPSLMSSVITLPPNGITAVCRIMPSLKIARSVVPPPISINATPASFSSWLNTASEEANGSRVMFPIDKPALLTHLPIFLIEDTCPTTTWKLASNRPPYIPMGSLISACPSTLYSWGSTWIISSPGNITNL